MPLFFQDFQMPPINLTNPDITEIGVLIAALIGSLAYGWFIQRQNEKARQRKSTEFESSLQQRWESAVHRIADQEVKIAVLSNKLTELSNRLDEEIDKNKELNFRVTILKQQLDEKDRYITQLLGMIKKRDE